MRKNEFLAHWETIPRNQPIQMAAVPYKHKGTTYAEDGIRITGSREFIDSVLSRLKDLLDYKSDETRLQVVYQESVDRGTQAPLGAWNCYIQVHERGQEAQIMSAIVRGAAKRGKRRKGAKNGQPT